MKVVAGLILGYFLMGFFAGIAVLEGKHGGVTPSSPPLFERPPLELPLEILLLGILLGLPALGYKRASRTGEFLHFSPRVWLFLPPSLIVSGFVAGLLTFRYM